MIESDYLTDNHQIIQKLKQMPTLELFDEANLQGALKLSKIREYESGETILEEGSYDNRIFFLISGRVKIEKDGKELSVLDQAGDVFGEMRQRDPEFGAILPRKSWVEPDLKPFSQAVDTDQHSRSASEKEL